LDRSGFDGIGYKLAYAPVEKRRILYSLPFRVMLV
jgi:hypothetical protein